MLKVPEVMNLIPHFGTLVLLEESLLSFKHPPAHIEYLARVPLNEISHFPAQIPQHRDVDLADGAGEQMREEASGNCLMRLLLRQHILVKWRQPPPLWERSEERRVGKDG